MGVQATVEVCDLLAAGVTCLVRRYESYVWDDAADCEQPTEAFDLLATFPDGAQFAFNMVDPRDTTVWCDFNHWGTNRPKLQPLLERHHVPWVEG